MWYGQFPTIPEFQSGNVCYSEKDDILYHYPIYSILKSCDNFAGIHESESQLKIYFSENKLIIKSNSYIPKDNRLKIFNLSGQLVLNKILSQSTEQMLDLSSLMNGLYFTKLETPSALYRLKFQKE